LVARIAAVRLGRGLGAAVARSEAARKASGEASSAFASTDDMGLGKTCQTLALLLAERERRPSDNGNRPKRLAPTLLICPMSVVGNWQREAERFAPGLSVLVHHGPERLKGRKFATAARRADLVITTYALATRDRETLTGVT
jgi:SNF2 family DNA or RNA helicase